MWVWVMVLDERYFREDVCKANFKIQYCFVVSTVMGHSYICKGLSMPGQRLSHSLHLLMYQQVWDETQFLGGVVVTKSISVRTGLGKRGVCRR